MLRPAKSEAFIRRSLRVILAILLAIVATFALNRMGIHRPLERLFLDLEWKWIGKPPCPQAGANPPCPQIAFVMITDDDYDRIFDGRSPLKRGKLQNVIAAIAAQHPRIIAIDIDTSHPQFRDLDPRFKGPDGKSIPIIWEREVEASRAINTLDFRPLDVLGLRPEWNKNSGIPVLLDDPLDKVTRFYVRCIQTKGGDVPSFVYAVKSAYEAAIEHEPGFDANHPLATRPICKDGANLHDPLLISFTLRDDTIDTVTAATALAAKQLSILEGRIVILGGTYRDYDRHFTPIRIQPEPGATVLANALQTELSGGGIPAPSHPFVVEAVAAILLVLIFEVPTLSPARVLVGGPLVTLMLALAFSYFYYGSLSGLRIFAPTLLAMLLFEIYEYVQHKSIVQAVHPNGTLGGFHFLSRPLKAISAAHHDYRRAKRDRIRVGPRHEH